MTISSNNTKNTYNGDGSTTVFSYTYEILSSSEIAVQLKNNSTGVITTYTLTTDYTVSNVAVSTGGNVTFLVAPPTGYTVILLRNPSFLQLTHYNEFDAFPAISHETALDRLTMETQYLKEQIARSIVLDPTISFTSSVVQGTPAAYNLVRVNGTVNGFEYASSSTIGSYSFPVSSGVLYQTAANTAISASFLGTANKITVTESPTGTFTFTLPATITANLSGNATTATDTASKTGTGSTYVTNTSPTLVTPTLGAAVATSISFGGTVLSNYVEGTFTPTVTLVGGSGNTVPVYVTNTGRYTRVGNRVFVDILLDSDGGAEGAGTGQINIALPIISSSSQQGGVHAAGNATNNTSTYLLAILVSSSSSVVTLQYYDTITTNAVFTGALQNNSTRQIRLQFYYEV